MLMRGVCGWEELSQWDSTKTKVAMVVPRLNDATMDTQSPEDGLLMVVGGCVTGNNIAVMIDLVANT